MILAMDFNVFCSKTTQAIESICITLVNVRIIFSIYILCAVPSTPSSSSPLLLLCFFCLVAIACFFYLQFFYIPYSVLCFFLLLASFALFGSNVNLCNVLFRWCVCARLYLFSLSKSIIFYRFNELLLKIVV